MKVVEWKTAPISCTCEVLLSTKPLKFCDGPTWKAYPAQDGGWMALCRKHSQRHTEATRTDYLIATGETWANPTLSTTGGGGEGEPEIVE